MLGGTPKSIEIFEPFARKLAPEPERGWLHCGPSGAGHYAKMIHNGIEYGMMQSLAEGFALLAARPELDIDLARLAETWRHGSVVRSWLLDLCAEILKDNETLAEHRAGGGRFGRRPLDRARVDRARRARARDHRGADEPLLEPGALGLRAPPARHDAHRASAGTRSRNARRNDRRW